MESVIELEIFDNSNLLDGETEFMTSTRNLTRPIKLVNRSRFSTSDIEKIQKLNNGGELK
jgi:hypothetical protein